MFRCIAGSQLTFTGAGQVVKRITTQSNTTGVLRILWNNGSSYASPVTGSLVLTPDGQYDYDNDFTVDCSLITAGDVVVEVCDLT